MKVLALGLLLTSFSSWATRIERDEDDSFVDFSYGEIRQCDQQRTSEILAVDQMVGKRLLELEADWLRFDLLGVQRDYVQAENRQWIEGAPRHLSYQRYWEKMGKTLRLMRESSERGINYQCLDGRDRDCQGMEVFAYVRFFLGRPRPMIYLCPAFYPMKLEAKAETIFHELSHYAASTEDLAGDWWAREKSDIDRAARDAYHLQLFMHDSVPRILTRQIWAWWWPRSSQASHTSLKGIEL